ncbi:MAG: glycosyltransferase [bacterium]
MSRASTPEGRILFVDHAAVLGGAELSLLDIATHFRDRGAVVLFEDGLFAQALVARGVAVILLAAGSALKGVKKQSRVPGPAAVLTTLRSALELARTARGFDLIYANSPKAFLVSVIAGMIAGRPVIWHLRDIISPAHFSRSNIRILVAVANWRAVRVVANSHATADAFVAAGARRDLMRVVHNGIDAAPFDSLPADARSVVRSALGISDDAFVVGSFSRLHPWKGQRVLLDALDRLPDVHGLIVGGALFSGEEAFEAELHARVARAPLAGRVQMLGTRDDVPALIASCDVVVHTSVLPEPFGRVLVEALLARRPLVASNAGGVLEIVEDGRTALLVTPGDADALANAIAFVRDHPAEATAMSEAGSSDVRVRFTRATMLRGVTAVIDDAFAELGA